jgi:hypothetical protein
MACGCKIFRHCVAISPVAVWPKRDRGVGRSDAVGVSSAWLRGGRVGACSTRPQGASHRSTGLGAPPDNWRRRPDRGDLAVSDHTKFAWRLCGSEDRVWALNSLQSVGGYDGASLVGPVPVDPLDSRTNLTNPHRSFPSLDPSHFIAACIVHHNASGNDNIFYSSQYAFSAPKPAVTHSAILRDWRELALPLPFRRALPRIVGSRR